MRVSLFKNRKISSRCHIWQMLRAHAKKRHVSFHTPGHKIGKYDLTELSFSDNLASPHGAIAKAERDITEILGGAASFILTDGSTSGVFSMLYAAKKAGVKKLLVLEPVHKSVYNACAVLDLTPLIIPAEYTHNIPNPPTVYPLNEKYSALFAAADALLLTSPDYFGGIGELEKISALCKAHKKLLLIDGAHGGHLHFHKNRYAGTYADLWVDGVHKSLPALTQGAVVSAKTERLADFLRAGVNVFRTTSPSYPIMASVEYAVKYPENQKMESLVREYAKTQPRVRVKEDWTKVSAVFGKKAFEAEKYFERKGIYPEFCDGNAVLFYLSPATTKRQFTRLEKVLEKAFVLYPYEETEVLQRIPAPVVFNKTAETEWVKLTESAGRACAENCGLFPPCTPLIFAGERVTAEKADLLAKADNVFGVIEGKILVFKEK